MAICYCDYLPLTDDEQWTKQAYRHQVSVDSFGGDEGKYQEYLKAQELVATV